MNIREILDAVAQHQLGQSEVLAMKLDELGAIVGGFDSLREMEMAMKIRAERVQVYRLCEVRMAFNLPASLSTAMGGNRRVNLTVSKVYEPVSDTLGSFSFYIEHDGDGNIVNAEI